jgi:serine phosphatase RsbU (regulator of sigma subunit)
MRQQLRILHLEDDLMDAELVQATLAGEGMECETVVVATGEDFSAALQRGGFHLILADFDLPTFDGMSALSIARERHPDLPFIFVSGRLGEEAAIESLRNGATDYVLKNRLSRLTPAVLRALSESKERAEHRKAEEALRESELHRYQLQAELVYAAQIQARLLPRDYPDLTGFEIAARCIPAKQVGGDFFDWQEASAGILSITIGDVMGKGIGAAMLMATVRAAIRSVGLHNRPAEALRLAEPALLPDLDNAESFVTLFHGRLDAQARSLAFVDCGHGYEFVRRANGAVEELSPRGLPLGVPNLESYREGIIRLERGDVLVLYSDGVIDARPELTLDNQFLAAQLEGAANAREMVDRIIGLTDRKEQLPDDVTVLVVRSVA